jgi:hypothetical protein
MLISKQSSGLGSVRSVIQRYRETNCNANVSTGATRSGLKLFISYFPRVEATLMGFGS